jgi:hypothetical protein
VWFSVSRDLKMDAARDLADLGHDTKSLNLYPEGDSSLPNAREPLEAHGVKDGVLFMTYSLLINSAGKGGRNCAARQVDEVGTLSLTLTLTLTLTPTNPNLSPSLSLGLTLALALTLALTLTLTQASQ